jgi:drug/metabolite transporter (DMT)-like permease
MTTVRTETAQLTNPLITMPMLGFELAPPAEEETTTPARSALVTFPLAGGALLAFAANSLLGRAAVASGAMDATSFAAVRVLAAAAGLVLIGALAPERPAPSRVTPRAWLAALLLVIVAGASAVALGQLAAGTAALIFFGAVQITMFGAGVAAGERPKASQWSGGVVALGGLLLLMAPAIGGPSLVGALLAGLAGVAWGVYSLLGRGAGDPLSTSRTNHLLCLPLLALAAPFATSHPQLSLEGIGLAALSGGVTTGLGSVLWYAAMARLRATSAASIQLLVPVLATLGGMVLLAETPSATTLLATLIVLGGVGLALGRSADMES